MRALLRTTTFAFAIAATSPMAFSQSMGIEPETSPPSLSPPGQWRRSQAWTAYYDALQAENRLIADTARRRIGLLRQEAREQREREREYRIAEKREKIAERRHREMLRRQARSRCVAQQIAAGDFLWPDELADASESLRRLIHLAPSEPTARIEIQSICRKIRAALLAKRENKSSPSELRSLRLLGHISYYARMADQIEATSSQVALAGIAR